MKKPYSTQVYMNKTVSSWYFTVLGISQISIHKTMWTDKVVEISMTQEGTLNFPLRHDEMTIFFETMDEIRSLVQEIEDRYYCKSCEQNFLNPLDNTCIHCGSKNYIQIYE